MTKESKKLAALKYLKLKNEVKFLKFLVRFQDEKNKVLESISNANEEGQEKLSQRLCCA